MQIKHLALAVVAAGLAGQAAAGGFALSEQSVAAGGTANAGRASNVQDASIVFSNPAAMHKLKQAQFTQALAFIDASSDISNAAGGLPNTLPVPTGPGTNDGDIVPPTFVPSGYFSSGDRGGWAWGVAAYGSFGLKTNHEDTYAGRVYGDKSSVKIITVQPTISYQVNDKISVGVGPTLNRLDAYLSKFGGAAGQVELEGDDMGYGFNVGLHADLTPATQAGIVYRSKVKYKINDGELKASNVGTFDASTSLSTPESVEASVSHKLTAKLGLHAGATWTRWSRLQELAVHSTAPVPALANSVESFKWKDSMGYAAGVTYAQSDKLELRAGLAYDNSPVSAEERSVRLPSGDRRIASVGAGYKLSPTQTIDVSYTYLDEEKVNVTKTAPVPYTADFSNKASIYGLQFTQKF